MPQGSFDLQLRERLSSSVPEGVFASKVASLLGSPDAKLFRPRLARIFGTLAGVSEQRILDVAVSAELLHVASLIHDDVVDESDERRGKPTLHRVSGPQIAVLAGDHLLAQSLQVTARLGPALVDAAARAMAEMSAAAAREVECRSATQENGLENGHENGFVALQPTELRQLALGKTGALFAYCCEAGPLLVSDLERARRWARAGLALGVAFQFVDDVVDLRGGAGKPRGADLRERNPNAVLSSARELGLLDGDLGHRLRDCVTSCDWAQACELLLQSPAVERVAEWVERELEIVRRELGDAANSIEVQGILGALTHEIKKETKEQSYAGQKHHHL